MKTGVHRGRSMTLTVAIVLALPGVAHAAATKPAATTKAASNVAQTTAQLNGSVNPNGADTRYFFQLGTNSLYGTNSPETAVGSGTKAVNVSAAIAGLMPATKYHYRIVATNSKGITKGADRTFTTKKQPLALSLSSPVNPLAWNTGTTLTGQLSGTGGGGRQIQLKFNPWPFTGGLVNDGNPIVTNADGTFSIPIVAQTLNTQFQVVLVSNPSVASPVLPLGVKVTVHTTRKPRRVRSHHRVRFSGTIVPAVDGQQVIIQKQAANGTWKQVAQTVARHRNSTSSSFRRRVKIRHSGKYRVFVSITGGAHVSNNGRTVKVKVIPRH